MNCNRRELLAGVSSGFLLAGFAGEVLSQQTTSVTNTQHPARILFNENPLGPSPKALAAITSRTQDLSRYPLGQIPQLERALRQRHGMPVTPITAGLSLQPGPEPPGSHDLVLGVGSSEILRAAAWAYCSGGGTIVEAYPGYAAIGKDAERIPGAKVVRKLVPLTSDFRIDVPAMIEAIDDSTRIIVLCNPNNPTGTLISVAEIEAIADRAPAGALVFVDEAYIEFVDNPQEASALVLALSRDNILISRTFSKIFGMAGLRIGYGVSSKSVIEQLKRYMLGGLALNMTGVAGAIAAMEDDDHLAQTRQLNRTVHQSWHKSFRQLGWQMAHSSACFCWVNVGDDCSALIQFLSQRGVLISGGQRWNLPQFVRISVGTLEENDRLIQGIKAFARA